MDELTRTQLTAFYQQLWLIRLFEEQVHRLASAGRVPGFVHLSSGQEAVAVGVCGALQPEDYLYSGHRAHGHVLAKGSDPYAVLAEILGRRDGVCGGRGGSMHLVDVARGVLGATGVVAGNLPLALGSAWAARERDEKRVTVVLFGDGAGGAGVFHESLNLASLWRLPVLFVCENNGYAEFSSRKEHSRVELLSAFAAPYEIPAAVVDGNDVLAVYPAAKRAVDAVRSGEGPQLLECMTYRLSGHYVGDPQQYRSRDEVAAWRDEDPIVRLRNRLLADGAAEDDLVAVESEVRTRVDEIVRRALAADRPDPAGARAEVYTSAVGAGWGTDRGAGWEES